MPSWLRRAASPIASALVAWFITSRIACDAPHPHEAVGGVGPAGAATAQARILGGGDSERWDLTDLPIARSAGIGFRPVYIYSQVPLPDPGKSRSQVIQDLLVVKLTEAVGAKGGSSGTEGSFFVDLASNDALNLSNTYHLEQKGWSGVCIEPNPIYWYRLAAYRKCVIVGAFVGEEEGKEVDVVLSNGALGGIVGEGLDNAAAKSEEKRNLVRVSTIFKQTNVPRFIDYLSLDVEGAEMLVMRDFPFDEYTFRFITVERPTWALRGLLESKGYHLMRVIANFGETLWMHESVPLSAEEVDEICNTLGIRKWSERPEDWEAPGPPRYS